LYNNTRSYIYVQTGPTSSRDLTFTSLRSTYVSAPAPRSAKLSSMAKLNSRKISVDYLRDVYACSAEQFNTILAQLDTFRWPEPGPWRARRSKLLHILRLSTGNRYAGLSTFKGDESVLLQWLFTFGLAKMKDIWLACLPNEPAFLDRVGRRDLDLYTDLTHYRHTLRWSTSAIAAEYQVTPDAILAAMSALYVEPLALGSVPVGAPTLEATYVHDHARWAELTAAGYTEQEIAYMHGIRPSHLRPEVDQHVMSFARPRRLADRDQSERYERECKREHTPGFRAKWARLHEQFKREFIQECDCNVTKAADLWEVSYNTAYKRVIALGLKPTSTDSDLRYDRWLDDLDKYQSIAAAAKAWGISYNSAYQRARRCGSRPQKIEQYSLKHKAERHATWKAELDRLGSVAAAQKAWGISYGVALYRARQVGWSKAALAIKSSPCDTKWLT
jgi:hypothetical protein